jgi:hypothetical protein
MDTHMLVDNQAAARTLVAHLQRLISHLDHKAALLAVTLLRAVRIILLANNSTDSSSMAAQVLNQVSMARRINMDSHSNRSMEDPALNPANTDNSLSTANNNPKRMDNKQINTAALAHMAERNRINSRLLQGKHRASSFRLRLQDKHQASIKINRMVNKRDKLPPNIKRNHMFNKQDKLQANIKPNHTVNKQDKLPANIKPNRMVNKRDKLPPNIKRNHMFNKQDKLQANIKPNRMVNKQDKPPANIKPNHTVNKVANMVDLAHTAELNPTSIRLHHSKLPANSSPLHRHNLQDSSTVSKAATACRLNMASSNISRDIKEETLGRILSMVSRVPRSIRLIRRISRASSRVPMGRRAIRRRHPILGGDESVYCDAYTLFMKASGF